MPKLKTKSGAKKRFKVTATGKVMHAQRGKRHGMIKRTKKQIRQLRGTRVLFKTDGDSNLSSWFCHFDPVFDCVSGGFRRLVTATGYAVQRCHFALALP